LTWIKRRNRNVVEDGGQRSLLVKILLQHQSAGWPGRPRTVACGSVNNLCTSGRLYRLLRRTIVTCIVRVPPVAMPPRWNRRQAIECSISPSSTPFAVCL
jgi:hypothetical protein